METIASTSIAKRMSNVNFVFTQMGNISNADILGKKTGDHIVAPIKTIPHTRDTHLARANPLYQNQSPCPESIHSVRIHRVRLRRTAQTCMMNKATDESHFKQFRPRRIVPAATPTFCDSETSISPLATNPIFPSQSTVSDCTELRRPAWVAQRRTAQTCIGTEQSHR